MTEQFKRNRKAIIENQFFGDGYYNFSLKIGQLQTLQEKTGLGAFALLNKFYNQEWFVSELKETIRLGLIGGGNQPKLAYDLTEEYVIEGYLLDHVPLAIGIIQVALSGVEDEPIDDDQEEPELDDESEDSKKN